MHPYPKSTSSTSVKTRPSLPKLTLDKPVLPSIGISFNDGDVSQSNLTTDSLSVGKVPSSYAGLTAPNRKVGPMIRGKIC